MRPRGLDALAVAGLDPLLNGGRGEALGQTDTKVCTQKNKKKIGLSAFRPLETSEYGLDTHCYGPFSWVLGSLAANTDLHDHRFATGGKIGGLDLYSPVLLKQFSRAAHRALIGFQRLLMYFHVLRNPRR